MSRGRNYLKAGVARLASLTAWPGRPAWTPTGYGTGHWLFARCVQESVGEPELRPVAVRLAP